MRRILMIGIAILAITACSKSAEELSNDGSEKTTKATESTLFEQDYLALVALYESTNGDQWPKWMNWKDASINRWEGVETERINGVRRVVAIHLMGMNLNGTLPAEIGNLTELRIIRLGFNDKLTGEIPAELFTLKNLEVVDLSYTGITGGLSAEVGNLTKLDSLNLHNGYQCPTGRMTGEIPATLGNLKVLRYLDLDNNDFSGEIPAEIGDITSLEKLGLWMNKLTGEIPVEICNLQNLRYLFMAGNQLSGNIPSEFGKMKNLKELYLDNNQLTGSIPSEMGSMTMLRDLDLGHNKLTGTIPAEIVNLKNLGIFRANDNALEGEIPAGLCNENPTLVSVCLQNNNLTGEIPVLTGFFINTVVDPWYCQLILHGNRLNGAIPQWLVQFPSDARKNVIPQQSGYGFTNEALVIK